MTGRRYSYEETHRTVKGRKQKRCIKCLKWKSESKFHELPHSKDGLKSSCIRCENKYHRERYRQRSKTGKRYYLYEERNRVVDGVKQKRCSTCKKWKAKSDFYKNSRYKDGLEGRCKKCAYEANKDSLKKRRLAMRN